MMGWRDVLCVDDFPADKVRLDTVSGEYVYGSGSWEDGMVYGSAVNGQGIWTEKLQIESLQVFHCLRYIWHSSHSIMLSPSLSWRSIATSRSFQLDKSWCLETKAPTTLATYQKLQLYDNDMFPPEARPRLYKSMLANTHEVLWHPAVGCTMGWFITSTRDTSRQNRLASPSSLLYDAALLRRVRGTDGVFSGAGFGLGLAARQRSWLNILKLVEVTHCWKIADFQLQMGVKESREGWTFEHVWTDWGYDNQHEGKGTGHWTGSAVHGSSAETPHRRH